MSRSVALVAFTCIVVVRFNDIISGSLLILCSVQALRVSYSNLWLCHGFLRVFYFVIIMGLDQFHNSAPGVGPEWIREADSGTSGGQMECAGQVVVDVANAGYRYGMDIFGRNKFFSWQAVPVIKEYYERQGLRVVFLCKNRVERDHALPPWLVGTVSILPVDDRHRDLDDIFCARYAMESGCSLVSNDNFRDMRVLGQEYESLKGLTDWCLRTLPHRRISFFFVRLEDPKTRRKFGQYVPSSDPWLPSVVPGPSYQAARSVGLRTGEYRSTSLPVLVNCSSDRVSYPTPSDCPGPHSSSSSWDNAGSARSTACIVVTSLSGGHGQHHSSNEDTVVERRCTPFSSPATIVPGCPSDLLSGPSPGGLPSCPRVNNFGQASPTSCIITSTPIRVLWRPIVGPFDGLEYGPEYLSVDKGEQVLWMPLQDKKYGWTMCCTRRGHWGWLPSHWVVAAQE